MPQETYQLTVPPHIPAIMKISCTLKKNKILNIRENFKTSKRVKTLTKFNIVVISILW